MAELKRTQSTGISVATEAEVLHYTYTGAAPIEVIARLDMGVPSGATPGPIAGGGSYTLNLYVNGVLVTPVSANAVPAGVTAAVAASRPLPLYQGDVLSIRVTGRPADTAVNVLATLRQTTATETPAPPDDGRVVVDHNYGGADALAYQTSAGAGIADGTIRGYLKSNYDAGLRDDAHLAGSAATDALGRWTRPMLLDPGTYVLVYYKTSYYSPSTVVVVVS